MTSLEIQKMMQLDMFSFSDHYGDVESGRYHFKVQRDKEVVTCKKCGGEYHYRKQDNWSYDRKSCKFRTSLRSGKVLQSSNLSFLTWYKLSSQRAQQRKDFQLRRFKDN